MMPHRNKKGHAFLLRSLWAALTDLVEVRRMPVTVPAPGCPVLITSWLAPACPAPLSMEGRTRSKPGQTTGHLGSTFLKCATARCRRTPFPSLPASYCFAAGWPGWPSWDWLKRAKSLNKYRRSKKRGPRMQEVQRHFRPIIYKRTQILRRNAGALTPRCNMPFFRWDR